MKNSKLLLTLPLVSMLAAAGPMRSFGSTGQSAAAPVALAPPATAEPQKDVLRVETKTYAFTVHQPAGWKGDTEAAKKYKGSVLFSPATEEAKAAGTLIMVTVDSKFDENIALHLQRDIQSYQSKYPHLELGEIAVKHPEYATFPKLFSQPGDFYHYITYVNPGTGYSHSFYVVMSKKKDPATPAELAAYKDVVESLRMVPPAEKPK